MGLLDDLKKQAAEVRSQQVDEGEVRRQNIRQVDQKMRQTFQYLNDLFKQLAILKPETGETVFISGIGQVGGMKFADSFIDYRTKRVDEVDYFDYINFYLRWQRPDKLVFESDMLGTVAKVRDTLTEMRFKFTEESVKNERGHAAVRLSADLGKVANITIKAASAEGKLLFEANNLTGPGMMRYTVPATAVDEALLESFAQLLLGQRSDFTKYRLAPGVR